ncbi:MAG: hypothetical protein IIC71_09815 [Acidobacteria bacterium]|nr:hypothetical protein [Acidobacteriota bacterium]
MNFDTFAHAAGRAAIRDARHATRPAISQAHASRRRRTTASVGLFSFLITLTLIGGGVFLWRGAVPSAPQTETEPSTISTNADPQRIDTDPGQGTRTTPGPSEFASLVVDGADGGCGIDNMPEDWQNTAIKFGPLWLWHVGPPGAGGDFDRSVKTIAVLEPGATVTLVVPNAYRDRVSHLFDSSMWNPSGSYRIAQGGAAVTFLPCESESAQFVGGFIFQGDPCVELDVTVGDADPFTATVSLSNEPCS